MRIESYKRTKKLNPYGYAYLVGNGKIQVTNLLYHPRYGNYMSLNTYRGIFYRDYKNNPRLFYCL